jgi:hypothetical protein
MALRDTVPQPRLSGWEWPALGKTVAQRGTAANKDP